MPPFFTLVSIACSRTRTAHRNDRRQQPNPNTQATVTEHWTKLILSYARHRRLFFIRLEDAEVPGVDWDEVLRNERINRMSAGESFLELGCLLDVHREITANTSVTYHDGHGGQEPRGLRTG